jgi:23S rRNA G2445 N2-methylase RlmL
MHRTAIMITTARGLEKCLAGEVRTLGLPVTWAGISGVRTEGTLCDAMRLNLHLRTGHRVLFLLRQCSCADPEALYRNAGEIPWERIIPDDGYVSISANVVNRNVRDNRFAALRCKDAIVDRIQRRRGRRPDSGPEHTGTVINVFWRDERCEIYLDTSGEPLSRRGYRKNPLGAPMQETLAAGVIMSTGWNGGTPFINPMCGSGTLAIEAALIAENRPPGLVRQRFGFMNLLMYEPETWKRLREEAKASLCSARARIIAADISPQAVAASLNNAKTAGVERLIEFSSCDVSETAVPEGRGIVIVNPEYGVRMGKGGDLSVLYRRIGDFFKKKCRGYTGYVFTGAPELAGQIGLKSKRRKTFYSGAIECRLYEYDLYGKR